MTETLLPFRQRLLAGASLSGTFIKTPTGHAIEILGDVGYDFVIIDEEHAPFDRQAIDTALLAARASSIPALVRVASPAAPNLLSVLDCGATGVLVPHVVDADMAQRAVANSHYANGKRGFSNSPRAGRYGGLGLSEHVARGDSITTVVAQIEDPEALDHIDAIARTDGVDALFIGRGDLAVAMGAASPAAREVREAAERISAAARAAGKPVMVFVNDRDDAAAMKSIGATAFVFSSDQGLMRRAAVSALADMRNLK
jgi:2-keto-3-deoxy-L-rhamnonate aldolase RhmA